MAHQKTSKRKKEHIEICLTDEIAYNKENGFDNYEFPHNAITEIDFNNLDLSVKFFNKKISFPFLISCMTGGTTEAEKINEKLAIAAAELNIPIGVGSQRQALEDKSLHSTYKVIRKNGKNIPVLGNIGAAQVAKSQNIVYDFNLLIDLIEADAMVVHLNPLQELFQKEGETNFKGLLKNLEIAASKIKVPIVVKEVGSGINKKVASKLLEIGIKGIDVAGSGGTSWAAVEMYRNKKFDEFFREWGMPTSYCVKNVSKLKKKYNFLLISSGGINNGIDIAKSISMGADLAAAARIILQEVMSNEIEGVVNLLNDWFLIVKKIMYLTGCQKIKDLQKVKLIKKSELY